MPGPKRGQRPGRGGRARRGAGVALALVGTLLPTLAGFPARAVSEEEDKLPRYFSLKSNPVNLRKGPGLQYPKVWIFRREGLPIEVLRAHERWREVRDSDGATGWVLNTLISRRRTGLVTPWLINEKQTELTDMRRRPQRRAPLVARLESGTLVNLRKCDARWCEVSVGQFRGWVEQERLWGVYPQEVLD